MEQSLVSIILATYRREQPLIDALKSLISQTYTTIEIILVDDNADKKWNNKVQEIVTLIQAETNIKLYHIINSSNQGSAETRNIGIKVANGKYITFLDDDDIYLKNKIQNQLNFIMQNNADVCITDLELFNENNKLIDTRKRNYIEKYDSKSLLEYHLKYHMTGTDTLMFTKDYLIKIGGFPPINVGDEFYLIKEAICNNGKFCYLPQCDVKAYVHMQTDGLSSGETKIKGENDLYNFKKSFFNRLDKTAIRYIKMRHYAVIAFAEIRRKKYIAFFANGIKSFCCSPIECVKVVANIK